MIPMTTIMMTTTMINPHTWNKSSSILIAGIMGKASIQLKMIHVHVEMPELIY